MTAEPVCEVSCDIPRNLIRISFRRHVSAADTKIFFEKAAGVLSQIRKGFTMLTDLSGLDAMDLDCVPDLTRMMDACRARGIATVVRIIPDPRKDIGLNILSIIHLGPSVRVVTCKDAAEAERVI